MLFLGFAEFIGQISLSITIYLFNWMLLKRIGVNGAAYFTSLGDYNTAALISILRSLILVCVLIIILPYLIGNSGIWLTAPLTELIAFAVSFSAIKRSVKGLLLVNEPSKNTQD